MTSFPKELMRTSIRGHDNGPDWRGALTMVRNRALGATGSNWPPPVARRRNTTASPMSIVRGLNAQGAAHHIKSAPTRTRGPSAQNLPLAPARIGFPRPQAGSARTVPSSLVNRRQGGVGVGDEDDQKLCRLPCARVLTDKMVGTWGLGPAFRGLIDTCWFALNLAANAPREHVHIYIV